MVRKVLKKSLLLVILCASVLQASSLYETEGEVRFVTVDKWPNGMIFYYFEDDMTKYERTVVKQQMNTWESACEYIIFIELKKPKNERDRRYLYRISIDRTSLINWSSVGYTDYAHCTLGKRATIYPYIILHELGHCLGLLHEHNKPDRDKFLNILWVNIENRHKNCFYKTDNSLINESSYRYDYASIMHYEETVFSKNGYPTMLSKRKKIKLGGLKLSNIDKIKIRNMYKSITHEQVHGLGK